MEIIKGIFIGVSVETLLLIAYALCNVSGKCSRLEEEQRNDENV